MVAIATEITEIELAQKIAIQAITQLEPSIEWEHQTGKKSANTYSIIFRNGTKTVNIVVTFTGNQCSYRAARVYISYTEVPEDRYWYTAAFIPPYCVECEIDPVTEKQTIKSVRDLFI